MHPNTDFPEIVFEDESILVIDKPQGLTVNRSTTQKNKTLQDFLLEKLDFSRVDKESEFYSRAGLVHRLDKDTSGLLLVAKTLESFEYLQKQFKERSVNKEYLAICIGSIPQDELLINAPIKRNPNNRLKYSVSNDGKEAQTKVLVQQILKKDNRSFSYVKVYPKTGRTHQIRVHLSAINAPVLGDIIYCSKRQYIEHIPYSETLMLHASKLSFLHPTTQEKLEFATAIPKRFTNFLKSM